MKFVHLLLLAGLSWGCKAPTQRFQSRASERQLGDAPLPRDRVAIVGIGQQQAQDGAVPAPLPRVDAAREQMLAEAESLRARAVADANDARRQIGERFQTAYAARGRPRLALLLDRTVSDQVLEWTLGKVGTPDGWFISEQRNPLASSRGTPEGAWLWAVEDGFSEPLRRAGAQLVDRSIVMRLTAAEQGGTGEAERPLSVRRVEMDALTQHADLVVELLVQESASAGYILRARVLEVRTGVILASADADGLATAPEPMPVLRRSAVEFAPSGPAIVEVTHDPNTGTEFETSLGPAAAATELAQDLMQRLTQVWSL